LPIILRCISARSAPLPFSVGGQLFGLVVDGLDCRIKVRIARRGIEDKATLGRHRWVVERIVSWLLGVRRLGLRYDRTQLTVRPLLTLGCVLINLRRLV
jgi:transposase